MNGWHFTHDTDGWRWHRITEGVVSKNTRSRGFGSLLECLDDATRNGYSMGAPAQDLRMPLSHLV
jgi:hypothetical protein